MTISSQAAQIRNIWFAYRNDVIGLKTTIEKLKATTGKPATIDDGALYHFLPVLHAENLPCKPLSKQKVDSIVRIIWSALR